MARMLRNVLQAASCTSQPRAAGSKPAWWQLQGYCGFLGTQCFLGLAAIDTDIFVPAVVVVVGEFLNCGGSQYYLFCAVYLYFQWACVRVCALACVCVLILPSARCGIISYISHCLATEAFPIGCKAAS